MSKNVFYGSFLIHHSCNSLLRISTELKKLISSSRGVLLNLQIYIYYLKGLLNCLEGTTETVHRENLHRFYHRL